MINWDSYRDLFPVVKDKTYFMTAGGGAMPTPVYEAIKDRYWQVMHRGGDAFGENIGIMESCREKIANLINAEKENIAFIPNVSYGMNAIANSLISQNTVLIPENDFPSTIVPWENINAPIEFISTTPDLQDNILEILTNQSTENCSLVTSSISYANGYQLNLDELAKHKKQTHFIINHTQGIGVFPVDVKKQKIDALVCSAYKWMCCGEGISFMYISNELFKKMKPALVGWRSIQQAMSFNGQKQYYNDARVFELGWDNMTIFSGLKAALELLSEIGIENIAARVSSLSSYLINALEKQGIPVLTLNNKEHISGNVLIGPLKNPNAVFEALQKKNIWVNARGNGIRVSLHFYNTFEDIEKLVRVMPEIMKADK
ncbi:aminotransferase class V [Legionella busanensis]|uniref:Aminotransferase class V n=1 Tax=Legionella busanensis TaxID=190655 RepID=A0A378JLN3_9GAMM|nr:aminotransferase class V-fold PLP-dependent enzyme [Legionella busanensis]STX51000.1 aminotransferase class V [Legionella busanensis]